MRLLVVEDDPDLNRQLVRVLEEAGVPTVAVATGSVHEGLMAVSIDDRQAAYDMTAHLIALGHRRIGFVMGNPNLTASARRLEGYRDALAAGGVGHHLPGVWPISPFPPPPPARWPLSWTVPARCRRCTATSC